MKVEIINKSGFELPKYETEGATCCDVVASIESSIVLEPLSRHTIPTGIFVKIPDKYEIQVRSRSGLAHKHGIFVMNSPGIIDPDYRGGIGVILFNSTNEPFTIERGMKIAQIALVPVEKIDWVEVDSLPETKRGEKGFGSTGLLK